jgi:hypothetical protein
MEALVAATLVGAGHIDVCAPSLHLDLAHRCV